MKTTLPNLKKECEDAIKEYSALLQLIEQMQARALLFTGQETPVSGESGSIPVNNQK